MIDATHDPERRSWVGSADGHADFPIQNLPAAVFSPPGNSRRTASQTKITGIAKNDRKNTVCPAGTWSAVDLIIEAMTMKTSTEASLKAMPRRGRMEGSAKVTATRRRMRFQVP